MKQILGCGGWQVRIVASGVAALLLASPAWAQRATTTSPGFGGSSTGQGGGSGFTGNSGGGMSGGGSGFSGGGSGGGMSGNSSTGGFIGGSGSQGFLGSSNTGTGGLGGGGRTGGQLGGGSTQFSIATTNPLSGYYKNPLQEGAFGTGSTNTSFGRPIAQQATNRSNSLTSGLGSAGAGRSGFSGTNSSANSSKGVAAPYSGRVEIDYQPPPVSAVQTEAQGIISRSSILSTNSNVQTTVENGVVVMQGQVGTDREKRLAEALLKLTPGVRDVRNDVKVQTPSSRGFNPQ